MRLEEKIMIDIKRAMLAKDVLRLSVCRAIKSELLLIKTKKNSQTLSEDKEIEILQEKIARRLKFKLLGHKLELYGTKLTDT